MSDFGSMMIQLDKERFKRTKSPWLSGHSSYEFDEIPCSNEEPQLDWVKISNQINRKRLTEETLTNRISGVATRMFRKDYK
jgi:hypothetical protein